MPGGFFVGPVDPEFFSDREKEEKGENLDGMLGAGPLTLLVWRNIPRVRSSCPLDTCQDCWRDDMIRPILFFARLAALFPLGVSVIAAEPVQEELPPPPRQLPAEVVPFVPGPPPISPYYRTSRYDVWQWYGVDRFGNFRPRVALTPYGAFYVYDGSPYPFLPINQQDVTPSVMGTPYRLPPQPLYVLPPAIDR